MEQQYELVRLSDLMEMRGPFGPTSEEVASPQMQEFQSALLNPKYEVEVPASQVYAAVCGDGRLDKFGQRFPGGYFAFGGGYMPILGEALADPESVLKQGLQLDTMAHLRLQKMRAANPDYRFVWHTADHVPANGIGCGLLAARIAVIERLASSEFDSFVAAGNRVGHTRLDAKDPLAKQLQHNSRILLDSNFLQVSDTSLREVPTDIKDLTYEEVLAGKHFEKLWKVEQRPGVRTRTSEIWPQFLDGNQEGEEWNAFVTSAWAPMAEAQNWTRIVRGSDGAAASDLQEMANAQYNAMGLITMSGIASLGNTELNALVAA